MHENDNYATLLLLQRPHSRVHCRLRQPHSRACRGPWHAQPVPGTRLQVPPRLLTVPEWSACPCKREWPRHAPAPVTRLAIALLLMGGPTYQRRAAVQNCCSK
eukprot:6220106-Pyramimonas_sp.AAC.1